MDRLISATNAANNVTSYAVACPERSRGNIENNLLSITDAGGNKTSFAYGAFRRVTQTTFPSTLTENLSL